MKVLKHLYFFLFSLGFISAPLQTKAVYVFDREHQFIEIIDFSSNLEEIFWLELLHLKDDGEFTINYEWTSLSKVESFFYKHKELVDSWAIVKNTGFDDLAKNTDVLEEISTLSAKTLDGNPLDVAKLAPWSVAHRPFLYSKLLY
ncbi:MAG: hypothetical protein M3421_14340 [Bacteroidota bacterium]|jgi:hypothetical protein|nr:hypothetical protein [Bacteroidota bacterium]